MSSYGSWLVFREVDPAPWNVAVVGADDDGSGRPQATLYPVIAPFVQWLDPFNDFRFVKTNYQMILLLTSIKREYKKSTSGEHHTTRMVLNVG